MPWMGKVLIMIEIEELGREIAASRKRENLGLMELAAKAGVSRTTLYLIESGRATDIGYSKLARILAALGLELRLEPAATRRPTLDDLLKERAE
jgi:transcriptional regulator with XRE-family HTH domain